MSDVVRDMSRITATPSSLAVSRAVRVIVPGVVKRRDTSASIVSMAPFVKRRFHSPQSEGVTLVAETLRDGSIKDSDTEV